MDRTAASARLPAGERFDAALRRGLMPIIATSLWFFAACANAAATPMRAEPATGASETETPDLITSPKACEPSGKSGARDYQVGAGPKQLASLDKVPWERLRAGDTVRIFYKPEPYRGKFALNAHGTAAAPVRVCGVKGPNGERPIIDGSEATTRSSLAYGRDSARETNETRGIIIIVATATEDGNTQPEHIIIDGLRLQGAKLGAGFVDSGGEHQKYSDFGAAIWIERGHHITIADNEIDDCAQAIFSRSREDGGNKALLTMDIRIAGNAFSGNGEADVQTVHTTYIQSVGAIYEFNHYGAMRRGASGNAIKDRSVGTIVRYNRIEAGTYAIDLVEAEDDEGPKYALSDPAYRAAFVYGNQIVKPGPLAIHYGGDHYGKQNDYRKGTLYFYDNTVHLLASDEGIAYAFRLSTVDEHAEVWNNVFFYDAGVPIKALRARQDVPKETSTGGTMNLGVNWINKGYVDFDPGHEIRGALAGAANFIEGAAPPIDLVSLVPVADGQAIGKGRADPQAVRSHPALWQLDPSLKPVARSAAGEGADLGAVER